MQKAVPVQLRNVFSKSQRMTRFDLFCECKIDVIMTESASMHCNITPHRAFHLLIVPFHAFVIPSTFVVPRDEGLELSPITFPIRPGPLASPQRTTINFVTTESTNETMRRATDYMRTLFARHSIGTVDKELLRQAAHSPFEGVYC